LGRPTTRLDAVQVLLSPLLVAVVLTAAPAACGASRPGQQSADYQKGYRIGLDAYLYGLPLMATNATARR